MKIKNTKKPTTKPTEEKKPTEKVEKIAVKVEPPKAKPEAVKPTATNGGGCFVALDDEEPPKAAKIAEAKAATAKAKPTAPKAAKNAKPTEAAKEPPKAKPVEVKPPESAADLLARHATEAAKLVKAFEAVKGEAVTIPGGWRVPKAKLSEFVALRAAQRAEVMPWLNRKPLEFFRALLAVAKGDKIAALAMIGVFSPSAACPFARTDWRLACEEIDKAKPTK